MENLRIIETVERQLDYINKKAGIARYFANQLHLKVKGIKEIWSKYGIIEIDYHNIYFNNMSDNEDIEKLSALCSVVITFNKEYSYLQATRMIKLIGLYRVHLINGDYSHRTGRYNKSSNTFQFELHFKQG